VLHVWGGESVAAACDTGFSDEILGIITSLLLRRAHFIYSFFFSPESFVEGNYRCSGLLKDRKTKLSRIAVLLFVQQQVN